MYDVIIIGAGFLGCMTAQKLSRYKLNVLVLEKEYDLGEGATKANSGILYPGIHARPGSLKARSNIMGNQQMDIISKELDVPVKRIGSLYLMFHEDGREAFDKRLERGKENQVPDLKVIDRDEILELEPLINPNVKQAIFTPSTGIISPFELILACGQQGVINGVEMQFNQQVVSIEPTGNYYNIHTEDSSYKTRYVVNTAGGFADAIESMVAEQPLVVQPRRGEYFLTRSYKTPLINHVLYQAQETTEGGTLMTPTIDGNILVGPTAHDAESFSSNQTTAEGMEHLKWVAKKIIPDFPFDSTITTFAGLRANITNLEKEDKDFFVRRTAPRFVSAVGIKNPGMTASPYLADLIIKRLEAEGLKKEKKERISFRKRYIPFLQQSPAVQKKLFKENPLYGEIVCRCEQITLGDLMAIQKGTLPPTSLDGYKKRLRVGMGKCQGGFCTSKMVEFLGKQGCSFNDIRKGSQGSWLAEGRLK